MVDRASAGTMDVIPEAVQFSGSLRSFRGRRLVRHEGYTCEVVRAHKSRAVSHIRRTQSARLGHPCGDVLRRVSMLALSAGRLARESHVLSMPLEHCYARGGLKRRSPIVCHEDARARHHSLRLTVGRRLHRARHSIQEHGVASCSVC